MALLQQPSADVIRGPGLPRHGPLERLQLDRIVYSSAAHRPLHKGEREGGGKKRAKGEKVKAGDEKQSDVMPGVLVAFHKGASAASPL